MTTYSVSDNSSIVNNTDSLAIWKTNQLVAFRIAFIFFVLMSIPLSWSYYTWFFSLDWFNLGYRDLTNMARFSPNLVTINSESGRWGLASYVDWLVLFGIAVLGAAIWSFADKNRKNYNLLYYWLRVIVRYRVAVGMIEFGFVKVFLIQMPLPPLGTLNTHLGDITAQKLYWLSVGIVPWYEIFLGLVEVLAGSLLFFRKTTMLGAFLTAGASANIVYANFAYDGGVHVYSSYFILLSVFLLLPYLPDFWRLLMKEEDVVPVRFYPVISNRILKGAKIFAKYGIMFLFLVVLSYLHFQNRLHKPFIKEPITPGLAGTSGFYQVAEFKYNNKLIPYSPFDSIRWQDATFEKYSTITFKVNKPIQLDLTNGVPQKNDVDRTWELTGIAGGRQYYYYEADTVSKVLNLFNKHKVSGRRQEQKKEEDPKPQYTLNYFFPDQSTLVLSGVNDKKDSIYVVLKKENKKYALVKP